MTDVVIDGRVYAPVDAQRALELGERIRTFTLEGETFWKEFFQNGPDPAMYEEGDELAPFFTEAFLYNLVGKDDARSIIGIIRGLSELAGVEYR